MGREALESFGQLAVADVASDERGAVVAGREVAMPESGVLTVPGLVRLEKKVVSRKTNGISVVGLRLTLLDGSGAVVDLARANLQVSSSGR